MLCYHVIDNTVVYTFLHGYSRVHRKLKCDAHRHFCLIFGDIGIRTSLSTLILKIFVAKPRSCAKVEFGDFQYDVIVQMGEGGGGGRVSFLKQFQFEKSVISVLKITFLRIFDCFYAAYTVDSR